MNLTKHLPAFVLGICFIDALSPAVATTIHVGDKLFPLAAEVVAADPDNDNFGDDASVSLSQTFQVGSTFDARSVTIAYEYDSSGTIPGTIDIEIFEVADVFASSMTPGTSVYSATGLLVPAGSGHVQFELGAPVTLDANTGAAGYAFQITNSGNPGFEWRRTGSTRGNYYAFGQFYEDGSWKNSGERDGTLAISSSAVPEPCSLALAALVLGCIQIQRGLR